METGAATGAAGAVSAGADSRRDNGTFFYKRCIKDKKEEGRLHGKWRAHLSPPRDSGRDLSELDAFISNSVARIRERSSFQKRFVKLFALNGRRKLEAIRKDSEDLLHLHPVVQGHQQKRLPSRHRFRALVFSS